MQRVLYNLLLLLTLDTEEPGLVLLPVDVVGFPVLLAIVVAPYSASVLNLVGISTHDNHVAVAGLEVHVGEVEGGALVLAEATVDLVGHVIAIQEYFEVCCTGTTAKPVGPATRGPSFRFLRIHDGVVGEFLALHDDGGLVDGLGAWQVNELAD